MSINPSSRKTYFGISALITAILAVTSLFSNFGAAYLRISPETFGELNNLTALLYCGLTQLAFVLGLVGYIRKNDSKSLALTAILLVVISFLFMFAQFVVTFT